MKRRGLPLLLGVCVLLVGCGGDEPTYQGKPSSEWRRQLRDHDLVTRRNAAMAIAKLDPKDPVARRICVEWTEKELSPLAMKAAISAGTPDGIKRDEAIVKVIRSDPRANAFNLIHTTTLV